MALSLLRCGPREQRRKKGGAVPALIYLANNLNGSIKGDQLFGEYQDANGLRLSGPLSRLMDFITNPDMARAMRKFLRTGGLRFVRPSCAASGHGFVRPLPYGRLSFAALICGFRTGG